VQVTNRPGPQLLGFNGRDDGPGVRAYLHDLGAYDRCRLPVSMSLEGLKPTMLSYFCNMKECFIANLLYLPLVCS